MPSQRPWLSGLYRWGRWNLTCTIPISRYAILGARPWRWCGSGQRPYLGEGMFRYYLSVEDFDAKVVVCDQALEIVEGIGEADLAHETRVVRSYVELARGVYWVAEQMATLDLGDMENQALVRGSLDRLQKAGQENVHAIRDWRR